MREKFIHIFALFLIVELTFAAGASSVCAQDGDSASTVQDPAKIVEKRKDAFHSTGFPLPRFVSLGRDKVYVRAGPGQKYPIEWVYTRKNYPVEVILEFGNWRKIRDIEGEEGWVFHALLSGNRYAIIGGKGYVPVYTKAYKNKENSSRKIAKLEPSVIVRLDECKLYWCKVEAQGFRGWVQRKNIWGVYEDEFFD